MSKLAEDFGLSVQRAARLVDIQRSSFYYKARMTRDDSKIISRMRSLIEKHKSIGLPMMHDILKREGLVINHKRTERIYKEQGLAIKLRKSRKRAGSTRLVLPTATRPNERWSMDFVQSVLWGGRRSRILAVVDQFTKECPLIEVDTSINGYRVSRVLEWLSMTRELPESITVDNGPEFAGMTLDRWAYTKNVKLDFIRPGKPVENAFIESFNGKLRRECLNQHHFLDLEEAKKTIEEWRLNYNDFRPHRSLDGLTPEEFAKQWQTKNNNQNYESVFRMWMRTFLIFHRFTWTAGTTLLLPRVRKVDTMCLGQPIFKRNLLYEISPKQDNIFALNPIIGPRFFRIPCPK